MIKETRSMGLTGAAWVALFAGIWVALLQMHSTGTSLEALHFSVTPGATPVSVFAAFALAAAGGVMLVIIYVRFWLKEYRQRHI